MVNTIKTSDYIIQEKIKEIRHRIQKVRIELYKISLILEEMMKK